MTYKPGTSTLRRSLPLSIARRLVDAGIDVAAHDPRADWSEIDVPHGIDVAQSVTEAARASDLLVLLTEWPEYRDLDYSAVAQAMRQPRLLDPKGFLQPQAATLQAAGITVMPLVEARAEVST
jgi:UDPglucose 6-dehydrogenase